MFRALPFIESERLTLRLLSQEDLEAVLSYWRDNQEHLAPYGPAWPDSYLTEEFWIEQIKKHLVEYSDDVSARMFLFERGGTEIVGNVSFAGILRSAAQFCYLGYNLAQNKQRLGYMTEILPLAINFAFDKMRIHRVMANYMPSNERSGRLLKRLGFTVEGYARDYLCLNGKWEDHILTSFSNANWK